MPEALSRNDGQAVIRGRAYDRSLGEFVSIALCLRCAIYACAGYSAQRGFVPEPFTSGEAAPVVPSDDEFTGFARLLRWRSQSEPERMRTEAVENYDPDNPDAVDPVAYAAAERTGLPRPMVEVDLTSEWERMTRLGDVLEPDPEPGCPATKRLPMPWINGVSGVQNADYFSFRVDSMRAAIDRLCCICGDPMLGSVAIAARDGRDSTSGGWGHPRCVVLAVRTCPHFTDPFTPIVDGVPTPPQPRFETVAYRWDGPGVGCINPTMHTDAIHPDATPLSWDQLRAWAKQDPFGLESGCVPLSVPDTMSS